MKLTQQEESDILCIKWLLHLSRKDKPKLPPIKFTKISCNDCGDVIQSSYSGDCVFCKCKKTMIDETRYYTRTSGDFTVIKES